MADDVQGNPDSDDQDAQPPGDGITAPQGHPGKDDPNRDDPNKDDPEADPPADPVTGTVPG